MLCVPNIEGLTLSPGPSYPFLRSSSSTLTNPLLLHSPPFVVCTRPRSCVFLPQYIGVGSSGAVMGEPHFTPLQHTSLTPPIAIFLSLGVLGRTQVCLGRGSHGLYSDGEHTRVRVMVSVTVTITRQIYSIHGKLSGQLKDKCTKDLRALRCSSTPSRPLTHLM